MLKTDGNIISLAGGFFLLVKVYPCSLDLSVSLKCHLEAHFTQKALPRRTVFEASVLTKT